MVLQMKRNKSEIASSKKKALTMNHLEKHIHREKYILLSNIQKTLRLEKKIAHDILNQIMCSFWKSDFNLISLPFLSKLCKSETPVIINGRDKQDPILLTKEGLRNLLLNESSGKKRTKLRPDLISDQLEYINGENALYKDFITEDWNFYQQIINRLNRKYHKLSQTRFDVNKENSRKRMLNLKFKQGIMLTPLIHLSTLAIELKDLLKIIALPSRQKEIVNLYLEKYEQRRTKLDDEFIFAEFISQKKIDCKKTNKDIAADIYHTYPEQLTSPERTLRIIHEEKNRSIERQLIFHTLQLGKEGENHCCTIADLLKNKELISSIAKDHYTTSKHVEKIAKKSPNQMIRRLD